MMPIYTGKGFAPITNARLKFIGSADWSSSDGISWTVYIVKKTKDQNPSMSLWQIWQRLKTTQFPDHHPWKQKMTLNEKDQIPVQGLS